MNSSSWKHGDKVPVIFAMALMTLACCQAHAIETPWERIEWEGTPNLPAQAVKGGRVLYVRFDLTTLQSRAGSRIEFPVPDGASILINKTGEERLRGGGYVWRGEVEGDEGSVATLSILNSTLVGDVILSNAKMYRIDQVAADVQIIFGLNPAAFPPGAQPLKASKPARWVRRRAASTIMCRQNQIDVMVIYTEAACAGSFVGQDAGCSPLARLVFENKIQTAETQTNGIFQNSLISPRIKVVHVRSAGDYADDAESLQQNLERLRMDEDEESDALNTDTTYLDDVHDWRNEYRADVVSLITKSHDAYNEGGTEQDESSACGLATLMSSEADEFEKYAFTVVPEDCMLSDYSFGHELAHLMGADHDGESSRGSSTFTDNRGYINTETPIDIAPWRTVMAENNDACMEKSPILGCRQLQYFSNVHPSINYFGEVMGSNDANNSRVVSESADTVAKFRRSLSCEGG